MDEVDTAEALVGMTAGAILTVAAIGAIGLFYLGRIITWAWRR